MDGTRGPCRWDEGPCLEAEAPSIAREGLVQPRGPDYREASTHCPAGLAERGRGHESRASRRQNGQEMLLPRRNTAVLQVRRRVSDFGPPDVQESASTLL